MPKKARQAAAAAPTEEISDAKNVRMPSAKGKRRGRRRVHISSYRRKSYQHKNSICSARGSGRGKRLWKMKSVVRARCLPRYHGNVVVKINDEELRDIDMNIPVWLHDSALMPCGLSAQYIIVYCAASAIYIQSWRS